MTGSNKSKTTSAAADSLTKSSPEASVELSEADLGEASGGAIYMNAPALGSVKLDSSLKLDKASDPNLLLPAVKPVG
ncbi:MAG TPA: hypothetical protein VHA35_10625 [Dongiaceae bacterium]|jgi:hypothetical protein|nr:hypothetical protein [Dongiaceae bacterium]